MANPRRGKPDCYVTSLTGLLAGEDFCRYSPWYRARFWVRNVDGDFDRAGWIADHASMLRVRENELIKDGWIVGIEKQNTFSLIGKSAKASGKPDILALHGSSKQALVSDVKTGARRAEHYWQVLFYMAALPKVRPDLHGFVLSGELVYKDGRVEIRPEEVTPDATERIWSTIREMGFAMPPEKTPSETECEACPIPATECREKASVVRATGETSEF